MMAGVELWKGWPNAGIPILFGIDAESQVMAEAYAIDNNNITMASVNFDIYDLAKMWEPEGYAEIGHHDRMHVSCMTQEEATMEIVIDPLDLSCRLARMTSMH